MADAVADDEGDPAVVEIDHVVPVATDLQRPRGGLIPHRETLWQVGRTQDRMLQRQSGFPLLVELVHALQSLPQPSGEHGEQRLILRRERPLLDQLDPQDQNAAGCCRAMPADPG